eukprot:5804059-Prymnesium_polylepis.1
MSLLRRSTSCSFGRPLSPFATAAHPSSSSEQSSSRTVCSAPHAPSVAPSATPPSGPRLLFVRSSSSSAEHCASACSTAAHASSDSNRWFIITSRFIDPATLCSAAPSAALAASLTVGVSS